MEHKELTVADPQDPGATDNSANAEQKMQSGASESTGSKTSAPETISSTKGSKSKYDWLSPVVLCILLLVLISAIRVYIGGPEGVVFVWKDELSFTDVVVNIADYANLPRSELAKHPKLLIQMEEMDLLNPTYERPYKRKRIRKNSDNPSESQSATP